MSSSAPAPETPHRSKAGCVAAVCAAACLGLSGLVGVAWLAAPSSPSR